MLLQNTLLVLPVLLPIVGALPTDTSRAPEHIITHTPILPTSHPPVRPTSHVPTRSRRARTPTSIVPSRTSN